MHYDRYQICFYVFHLWWLHMLSLLIGSLVYPPWVLLDTTSEKPATKWMFWKTAFYNCRIFHSQHMYCLIRIQFCLRPIYLHNGTCDHRTIPDQGLVEGWRIQGRTFSELQVNEIEFRIFEVLQQNVNWQGLSLAGTWIRASHSEISFQTFAKKSISLVFVASIPLKSKMLSLVLFAPSFSFNSPRDSKWEGQFCLMQPNMCNMKLTIYSSISIL